MESRPLWRAPLQVHSRNPVEDRLRHSTRLSACPLKEQNRSIKNRAGARSSSLPAPARPLCFGHSEGGNCVRCGVRHHRGIHEIQWQTACTAAGLRHSVCERLPAERTEPPYQKPGRSPQFVAARSGPDTVFQNFRMDGIASAMACATAGLFMV